MIAVAGVLTLATLNLPPIDTLEIPKRPPSIEIVGLDHSFALAYLVYVLIVVSVGGLGSIGGSFAAAALLGISDMFGKYYFPQLGAFLIYLVMIAILMWRPAGLFGRR